MPSAPRIHYLGYPCGVMRRLSNRRAEHAISSPQWWEVDCLNCRRWGRRNNMIRPVDLFPPFLSPTPDSSHEPPPY